jgi:hypothetical protein
LPILSSAHPGHPRADDFTFLAVLRGRLCGPADRRFQSTAHGRFLCGRQAK